MSLALIARRLGLSITTVSRALGGFDDNPALISYEDQDFWLRFVTAGLVAEMVPEIVGVGRHPVATAFGPSTWMPEATAEALSRALGHAPAAVQ